MIRLPTVTAGAAALHCLGLVKTIHVEKPERMSTYFRTVVAAKVRQVPGRKAGGLVGKVWGHDLLICCASIGVHLNVWVHETPNSIHYVLQCFATMHIIHQIHTKFDENCVIELLVSV